MSVEIAENDNIAVTQMVGQGVKLTIVKGHVRRTVDGANSQVHVIEFYSACDDFQRRIQNHSCVGEGLMDIDGDATASPELSIFSQ